MGLEFLALAGAYGLFRTTLKGKHLETRWAFLGPISWLTGEFGGFFLGKSLELSHSAAYWVAISGAVLCVVISKLVIDRLPAQQYSCPVCSEIFSAEMLDPNSELKHTTCGSRIRVSDGNATQIVPTTR